MTQFAEVDITDWLSGPIEQLGTKPKHWYEDSNDALWLFKQATRNRRADGSRYAKGDDWSERVACSVARELSLPAAEVELAVLRSSGSDIRGVISSNEVNPRVTLLNTRNGASVGWAQDYLLDLLHELEELNGDAPTIDVERVNPASVAPHLRCCSTSPMLLSPMLLHISDVAPHLRCCSTSPIALPCLRPAACWLRAILGPGLSASRVSGCPSPIGPGPQALSARGQFDQPLHVGTRSLQSSEEIRTNGHA